MLPKQQRLTRNFSVVFQKGAKINTPFFVLRAVPAWDDAPRLAVVVSKKAAKLAVRRNRIRRRLFAVAEAAGFPGRLTQAYRIVLIGHATALEADFAQMVTEMEAAFARLENWRFPPRPTEPPQNQAEKSG